MLKKNFGFSQKWFNTLFDLALGFDNFWPILCHMKVSPSKRANHKSIHNYKHKDVEL